MHSGGHAAHGGRKLRSVDRELGRDDWWV
jgi:hypothetical protein